MVLPNRKILFARRKQGERELRDGGDGRKSNKKDKNKGARWAKGHSCVSNPSVTKHREEASSMFLHPIGGGNSLLTAKNLNANRDDHFEAEEEDDMSILSSDVASLTISDSPLSIASSVSSVRSLASGWSQVSHSAFERFLRKFKGDFAIHKDMLSILGAASEIINEAGGKKNETEFFATFMSLLDSCEPDQYQPVMSLICIVIGKVSPGVLKIRFSDIYPKIGTILSHAVENDDELLICTTIEAFTKLIKVQDKIVFEEDKSLEGVFYMVLKCALHSKPKIRRKVRHCYKAMMLAQNEQQNNSAIPKLVLGWILDQLSVYPTCESKVVADALTLLTFCWSCIQKMSFAGAKKLYEGVLRVMSSGDSSIMKIGLCFFTVVFQNNVLMDSDPTDTLASKLIVALWELQPDWRNSDTFNVWLSCILIGMVRSNENQSAVTSYLPLLFEKLHPIWLTNHGKIALKTMKEYLPHIVTQNTEINVIESCFQTLSKSYLIVPPNLNALQVTDCMLESLNAKDFTNAAREVFLQLAPLRESFGVTNTLGKFIKAFGVEKLWTSVEESVRWNIILPLINENLDNENILFWKKEILPYIGRKGKLDTIWDSLVGFCRNPKDPDNFPAELVGKVISEKPELRISALSSLRQFIDWTQSKPVAIKYSKNFLPLLFNLYIQEKSSSSKNAGHADSIGLTLKKYTGICEKSFLDQLLEKALTRLQNSSEQDASPVYDLIAFMSFSITDSTLQKKVIETMKADFSNNKERKRIYRVLSSLANNEDLTEENLTLILNILSSNKGETKSNAAAIRLECINIVTRKNNEMRRNFLLEVILQLVSVNAKAKRFAAQFVLEYCSWLKASDKSIEELIGVINTGMQSDSPLIVSSTIYFSFLVVKELKPSQPNKNILEACFKQLNKSEDPIIWKYCLAFVNLCLSMYKGQMGPFASAIGSIAGQSKYPRREVNKILARMIRVFGAIGLKAVLPNSDEPKMKSRVKNICSKLRKMKEEKTQGKHSKKVDDYDSGEENDEEDFRMERMDSHTPVVIKEGLVDFLSPSEITKALVSDKKPTKPEDDFKFSEDGKIIIGNDDDEDDDGDELGENDEDAPVSRRKRTSAASSASSRRTSRTQKTTFSSKSGSRKRKGGDFSKMSRKGEQSDSFKIKSKKFKSSSSVSSSKKFRK